MNIRMISALAVLGVTTGAGQAVAQPQKPDTAVVKPKMDFDIKPRIEVDIDLASIQANVEEQLERAMDLKAEALSKVGEKLAGKGFELEERQWELEAKLGQAPPRPPRPPRMPEPRSPVVVITRGD